MPRPTQDPGISDFPFLYPSFDWSTLNYVNKKEAVTQIKSSKPTLVPLVENTMTSGTERWVVNQLPQPARPPNSYDPSFQPPEMDMRFQVQGDEGLEESYRNSVTHHAHMIAGEGRVRDRLKSEVEGLFTKLENRGGFQDNEDIQSRGIDKESSHKLERFKVRTVVAEEVVKEEDRK